MTKKLRIHAAWILSVLRQDDDISASELEAGIELLQAGAAFERAFDRMLIIGNDERYHSTAAGRAKARRLIKRAEVVQAQAHLHAQDIIAKLGLSKTLKIEDSGAGYLGIYAAQQRPRYSTPFICLDIRP